MSIKKVINEIAIKVDERAAIAGTDRVQSIDAMKGNGFRENSV